MTSTTSHTATFPGCFIVIEGVDGAGKTELAKRLTRHYNEVDSAGYNGAIYTREPGGTTFGNAVRAAFLANSEPLAHMTEVLALLACKVELLDKVVRPAMREGKIVFCDRFTRTLLAYQGGLRGIPYEFLISLLAQTGCLVMPHMELFLQVDADISRLRRGVAVNHMDTLAEERGETLRSAFAEALQYLPATRRVDVDASGTAEEVFTHVEAVVRKHLKFHRISGQGLPSTLSLEEYQLRQAVRSTESSNAAVTA
jgi:dTMP kinase